MKEAELRKFATCAICREKILARGVPLFYRVTVERFGVELAALNRQQGLTMLLGGSARIAAAMGPDEDLARPIMEPQTFAVCEHCSTRDRHCIASLAEVLS